MATKRLTGGEHTQHRYPGRRGDSRPRQDGTRFHHATQNDIELKAYQLFIYGSFHLIFLDHLWPWVTETGKRNLI